MIKCVGVKETIDAKGEMVEIVRCKFCQHLFTNPLPLQDVLTGYYSSQNTAVMGSVWVENYLKEELNPLRKVIIRDIISTNPNSILEVGCGDGLLLDRLLELGYAAHGIEPGNWVGNSNISNSLSSLPENRDFDCFVFQDVLEHVEDPLNFLSRYLARSREIASVIITIPAGDSLEAKTLGMEWEMVRPFGHLHYFSKNSLNSLAKQLNLNVTQIRRFRRESHTRSIFRIVLLPILWTRHAILNSSRENPYSIKNARKFLALGISRGDQYYVVLAKQ
jgi:SAM-dependent methyltransferase